jgi:NAD(P)-dependent dehydrogenase (short-subunit alcohol dehydrogenase family)
MTTLKKLMSLKNRTALVTGASGNLGSTISETLAELGCNLILTDISSENLKILKLKLNKKYNVNILIKPCNVEINNDRKIFFNWLLKRKIKLNIIVNNAAFVGASNLPGWNTKFEDQSVDTWRRAFEVNVTFVFDLIQTVMPLLRNTQKVSIINIASIYGLFSPDWSIYEGTDISNPAAYASSKGALIQLTRWLSSTLAPSIRVNAISPGGIYRSQPKIFVENYRKKTLLGRMANESDFKGVIAFLASDLSEYITGQNLIVDGGWSA